VDEVIRSLLDISASRPRKKSELMLYSEMFYESKLKDQFDAMWKTCLQSGIPPKKRIHFIKQFTTECFSKESEELKMDIREKCERENNEALESWKGRMDWSATVESYEA
jgi:ATP-dependent helicase/DNAse subunit B